jgi:7-carboxy-7-deazaguanine synthase
MFGQNIIMPILKDNGAKLSLTKIFRTIQGEGPFVGQPAIFVRLAGCNLQCKFCDTDFQERKILNLSDIISEIELLANNIIKLVVITGGEPLRQNIVKLTELLIAENFKVQIETNGTIKRSLPDEVSIICSPKNNLKNGQYNISSDLINYVDAFKFIISKTNICYNEVPKINTDKPIYIQPMDEGDSIKNKNNLDHTIKLAQKHNYFISLQTHKIMNIE